MGPNMARGWEASSAGTKLRFSNSPVDDRTKQTLKVKKILNPNIVNTLILQVYAVPDNGKCSKMFDLSMLAEYGTILCSSTTIHENVVESLINNAKDGQDRPLPVVLILGSYYKRGFVEILDPSNSKDPSAFDKCYWLVYFSVQGFLKTIKDERESEATRNIIEDTINRNSKGLKKKPRKKSIQIEIHFCPAIELADVLHQRPIFPLSPPNLELPSQVEDIVNRSSQETRRTYQDQIQQSLLYIPPSIGIIYIPKSIQNSPQHY